MSVSGYSVAHDPEVQQYEQMRAVMRSREKEQREREQRESRAMEKGSSEGERGGRGFLRRMLSLKGGRSAGVKTTGTSSGSKEGAKMGKRMKEDDEKEDGWWSDAETEIDLTEALKGEMRQKEKAVSGEGKKERRVERAPPYVFLSALPGVTVSSRRAR